MPEPAAGSYADDDSASGVRNQKDRAHGKEIDMKSE